MPEPEYFGEARKANNGDSYQRGGLRVVCLTKLEGQKDHTFPN